MPLPDLHRQICDWLRLEAARELLFREFMTVPERIPASSAMSRTVVPRMPMRAKIAAAMARISSRRPDGVGLAFVPVPCTVTGPERTRRFLGIRDRP